MGPLLKELRSNAVGVCSAVIIAVGQIATVAADNRSVAASKISLPSGPGSIEGLGESFEPQLNTGTYSLGLPLKLPAVRGGVQPKVRLAYNSGSGNGPLGLGWRLDVPSLQRQTDKGLPNYTTNDTFVDFGGEELVRLADGTFRAENETDFTKWENLGTSGWRATRRDGTILRFGQTGQARQNHPTLGTFKWMLESAQDLNGNRVEYSYVKDAGQIYLDAVQYGHHATLPSSFYRLTFQYETNRPDCLTDYRGRFRCETRWRLGSAMLEFEGRRIRFWRMSYHTNSPLSLLASFTQFGDQRSNTGTNALLNTDYLPPVSYHYSLPTFGEGRQWADVGPFANVSLAERQADLVDLNRDGLQDVLLYDSERYYSYLNRGLGRPFGALQSFTSQVSYPPLTNNATRLADLRGDGSVKVLVEDSGSYYYRAFTSPTTLGTNIDYLVPGSFPISNPEVQVVDIDNDRALDFVAADVGDSTFAMVPSRAGTGSATVQKSPPTSLARTVRFADGWQFTDMNGDRMPDLVAIGTVEDGGTIFYPGKGYGEFDTAQLMAGGPRDADLGARRREGLSMVDLDLDGLADLVMVDSGAVKVWANRSGKAWATPVSLTDTQIPEYLDGSTAVRFADMNGNGSVDIVWNDPEQNIFLRYLDLHPSTKPNVMTSMANGMGKSLDIEYRTSTDFMLAAAETSNAWTVVPPFPVPVVSAFTERDGLGSTYRTEISYRNGYYDTTEREFRGFEIAIRSDIGNDSQGAPTLLTQFHFDTGAVVEALKGKPLRVERRTVNGEIFDRVSTVWTNRQLPLVLATNETRRVNFAFEASERSEVIEKGIATPVTLLREFGWDDYGNQTRLADYGRVEGSNRSAWDDERIVARSFTASFPDGQARWILGLPVTETITDENTNVVTQTEYFYDDETFSGGGLGGVLRGNLTLQRRLVDPQTGYKITQLRHRYDGYGNIIETYDPLGISGNFNVGHVRQLNYDPSLHTYPVTEIIHVGGATPLLFVSAAYDLGLGVMISSADFNTNASFYHYDTFGRIVSITKPGDTTNAPTELYSYQLGITLPADQMINYIEARKRETAGGTSDSRLFFDGLGRKIMVRAEGETPEQTVVTDTVAYNDRRGVWKKYLPYFDTGGLGWKGLTFVSGFFESHYDALGRPKRAYQPEADGERAFAETTYEPLARLNKDEEQTRTNSIHFGSAMRHIEDGLQDDDGAGRLRRVQEIVKLADSGEPMAVPQTWATSYEYDLLDQLTHITDSQNNIKQFRYDGLARKIFMNDPDRGVMTFVYDDASNLTESTDAKNQRITYSYDGVNRILTEEYYDENSAEFSYGRSPDVTYHYDTPYLNLPQGDNTTATAQNVRGMLAWVEDLSGEEHTSFDARGRVDWTVKRIPAPQFHSLSASGGEGQGEVALISYKTAFAYDSLDRVTRLVYPDNDQITYQYNERSLLQRIPGGPNGSVISNIIYQPSAQLRQTDYGNGVRTTYDYDPRLRLTKLLTVGRQPSGAMTSSVDLINFSYTFDAASNIRQITDQRPGTAIPAGDKRRNTQIFNYDELYRLTRVQYSFAVPSPSPLGGERAGVRGASPSPGGEGRGEGGLSPQQFSNDGEINYRYDRIGNMLAQTSTIDHSEKGLPVANLGEMHSGGSAGRFNRIGRHASDPPGPHALTSIRHSSLATRHYPYDSNGNMTDIDGLKGTWDFNDRLVRVENDEMIADYRYDYTDRRISKRVEWKSGSSLALTNHESRITTLYVNKFFEVREHDAPTKYVWNGDTRVARVTGTLSPNTRIQRLRLYRGWNLCSLAVTATNALEQLTSAFSLQLSAFRWNSITSGWDPVTLSATLPAGSIFWIHVDTNTTLSITGTYQEPTNQTVTPGGGFYPAPGLQAWMPHFVENGAGFRPAVWKFDAPDHTWVPSLNKELTAISNLPHTLVPGEAIFVHADATTELQTPDSTLQIRYYHQDHLDSSSCLTDEAGNLIEEATNYPFGHPRHQFSSRGPPESYQFTQKERDKESGLDYFEARFLASNLDTFISVDPLGASINPDWLSHPQMGNLYAYAVRNPVKYIDPDGLSPKAVIRRLLFHLGMLLGGKDKPPNTPLPNPVLTPHKHNEIVSEVGKKAVGSPTPTGEPTQGTRGQPAPTTPWYENRSSQTHQKTPLQARPRGSSRGQKGFITPEVGETLTGVMIGIELGRISNEGKRAFYKDFINFTSRLQKVQQTKLLSQAGTDEERIINRAKVLKDATTDENSITREK